MLHATAMPLASSSTAATTTTTLTTTLTTTTGGNPYSDRAMDDLANFYADHGIGMAKDERIAQGRLLWLT
jgi:hypothetical protein